MARDKGRTGKPALMKELNIGLIMDALQKMGRATRVELAAFTKLSQPTVNMLIGELVNEQAVIRLGIAESTGGRRAELFALNSKRAALAAVLVKRDVIEAVVTDLDLNVEQHERRQRTEGISCTQELTELIHMLVEKRPEIHALCVGVPGSVSVDGEVFAIPMIPEWEHFGLKDYLERRFSASVCIMNDMNAIVTSYLLGGQEHAQNFVYLHAEGDGMGAGIVIDGRLYSGSRSFAGEVGSMLLGTVKPDRGDEDSEMRDHRSKMGEEDVETGEDTSEAGEELPDTDLDMRMIFGGISAEGLMHSNAYKRNRAGILTSIVINLICVLNPEEILFGGDITEDVMRDICGGCRAYLSESVLPRLRVVSNDLEDYFNGLCMQGREMLNRHIRIV